MTGLHTLTALLRCDCGADIRWSGHGTRPDRCAGCRSAARNAARRAKRPGHACKGGCGRILTGRARYCSSWCKAGLSAGQADRLPELLSSADLAALLPSEADLADRLTGWDDFVAGLPSIDELDLSSSNEERKDR